MSQKIWSSLRQLSKINSWALTAPAQHAHAKQAVAKARLCCLDSGAGAGNRPLPVV
ncbi:hypothetical protein [Limnohabitans sp. 2KL-51]|uniref:hypothetical protein n=1 Tax=Limnohabitans sp. 2KL-51 TaxID=1977911 RepID=UPI001304B45E|nr:hypothetical protein [Limnohabitans sp. 2KL-51]